MNTPIIHVVAAAIFNSRGEVLLARRPDHLHQGGLWEFPGGKVEPGESVIAALARELDEELGIVPQRPRPLIRIRHDYPDKSVLLDVWRVAAYGGQAVGREGQPLCWVAPDSLPTYAVPAANRAIISAVRLPATYLITPDPGGDTRLFLHQLRSTLEQGVRLVRLRAWAIETQAYRELAQQVLVLCHAFQAQLLLSGRTETVLEHMSEIAADGLHLSSRQLLELSQRPVAEDVWLAASCHDLQQLEKARSLGVDFVTLSPLLPTRSHANASPMGWGQFKVLVDQATMPVYALGGMTIDDLQEVRQYGAQGIAAISSLWGDDQ